MWDGFLPLCFGLADFDNRIFSVSERKSLNNCRFYIPQSKLKKLIHGKYASMHTCVLVNLFTDVLFASFIY